MGVFCAATCRMEVFYCKKLLGRTQLAAKTEVTGKFAKDTAHENTKFEKNGAFAAMQRTWQQIARKTPPASGPSTGKWRRTRFKERPAPAPDKVRQRPAPFLECVRRRRRTKYAPPRTVSGATFRTVSGATFWRLLIRPQEAGTVSGATFWRVSGATFWTAAGAIFWKLL